jgi:hypothetical protein
MKHAEFGKKADGSPYVIELGANWVRSAWVALRQTYRYD